MLSYLLDLFHIGWLFVAGHHQVDQCQEGPNYQSDVEHIMLVKGVVESEVVDLQAEDHEYLRVAGVRGERTDAQLHHSHRRDQH